MKKSRKITYRLKIKTMKIHIRQEKMSKVESN